ncbi:hypothetical protein [Paraburkholderia sp. JHI869]|uniref:hypothetical protein n=1 Tax=Paraburkholderia sp. JHI869 TaxID=3112959 RepID=UPI0031818571
MNQPDDPISAATHDVPVDLSPVPLLEAIRSKKDKTWERLAPHYGVTNPDPPWKVTMEATFECLSGCNALPSLQRRHAEDRLGETLYSETPAPEQQLLSLAHTMLKRGLLSEEELAKRMSAIRTRLEMR